LEHLGGRSASIAELKAVCRVLPRLERRVINAFVAPLFAWLHNGRRVVTRWERYVENYLGMVQLACARILLRASI
jgi:transposase